jgi:hypothetical protein
MIGYGNSMFLATHGILARSASTPAFSYLLDTYSGASAAYSLRKLSSTYSGNCIRVRRSSDNTEQNIGFVNNVLDTASLLSFVGAGNGFVTTWYDQSGNTKNATQTTAASQPKIVSSGNLITTSNGKITVDCYNSSMGNTIVNNSGTAQAVFSVYQNETTLNASVFALPFGTYNAQGLSGDYFGILQSGSGASPQSFAGTWSYYKNGSSTPLTSTRGGLHTGFVNGLISLTSTFGTTINGSNNRFIQYSANTSFGGNYKVSESIIYQSNQTTNKTGIETNINNYWNIY